MKALSLQNTYIFRILAVGLCVLTVVYIYCIQQAVRNVVERERLADEINVLHGNVAELEGKYVALKGDVTLPVAYALGFKEVGNPQFIERHPLGAVSLNTIP